MLALLWQICERAMRDAVSALWARQIRRFGEAFNDGLPDRRQARLWWRPGDSFFPLGLLEEAGLQEGQGNHRHQRMSVKPLP